MLRVLLLSLALGAQVPDAELEALEAEIARLEGERAGARTFADNAKRAEIDKKIALLKRIRDRASSVMAARARLCANKTQGPQAQPGVPAAVCANAGAGVVGQVRRAEELRERLQSGDWGWHNRDERAALQKELETLDRSLGL
ncbi:MAG: hypothetical protein AB2A00_15850 [Myxococcota bacterium]